MRAALVARLGLVFGVVALMFAAPVAIAADAAGTGGHWSRAKEIAGNLNTGLWASFDSISCPSAGNCAAGGDYRGGPHRPRGQQAYVVNEVKGRWRKAEEVPGTAKLNKEASAETMSVSCSSPGNCAAGGYYSTNSGRRPLQEPFVVNEVRGHWGKAEEVPGMRKMNRLVAEIESVSCSSPGNCSAGGLYGPSTAPSSQLFVVDEVNGRWGKAEEIPGIARLNHGDAQLESLSCASAGNCAAGGSYVDSSRRQQAFVVDEVKGRWGKAEEVPGTAKLNTGGLAWLYSLSCPSARDCAATGQYGVRGGSQAFVVNEVKGRWRKAEEIPGLAKLNTTLGGNASSISCASPGNCAAGGYYTGGSLVQQAFVVNERHGVWGHAKPIPGLRALNKPVEGGDGNVQAISCSSAADCAAGGTYRDAAGHVQAFLANETNRSWGRAEEVPGTARLNAGGIAGIDAISCSRGGTCGAGGTYSTRPSAGDTFYFQAFATNYTPPHR